MANQLVGFLEHPCGAWAEMPQHDLFAHFFVLFAHHVDGVDARVVGQLGTVSVKVQLHEVWVGGWAEELHEALCRCKEERTFKTVDLDLRGL